ncbi:hypothetical protein H0H92_010254 [Tricholoma furcatifolium]|nr:hypothetical protein H0H92_010254 [Tricholoma furcatifolium]
MESLAERTVPQLKAICKERKIQAYSKLQKAAIIHKILEHSRREMSKLVTDDDQNTSHGRSLDAVPVRTSRIASQAQVQSNALRAPDSVSPPSHAIQDSVNTLRLPSPPPITSAVKPLDCSSVPKRTAGVMQLGIEERHKKQKVSGIAFQHISRAPNSTTRTPVSLESREKAIAAPISSASVLSFPALLKHLDPPSAQAPIKKINRRFIPLVVGGRGSRCATKHTLTRATCPQDNAGNHYDLDFDNPPLPSLQVISMPPSLSQRKHVANLSIIFSFISLEDLSKIAQCSRLFRYAGLNAQHAHVVDVQEVVEGEIWRIESFCSRGREIVYVLEGTCEAIGHPEPDSGGEHASPSRDLISLRADWSSYVKDYMSRPKDVHWLSLTERLKWANYEEYHRGISKLWLATTQTEGEIGVAKRIVAERYVLACVHQRSLDVVIRNGTRK